MMRVISIFLALFCTVAPCLADPPETYDKKPSSFPDDLILLPGAKNIRYYELGGSFQLIYEITSDYPATETIKTISEELGKRRWHPLKEDYLNPGVASSHAIGWTDFQDLTRTPLRQVHQWLADWENEQGAVLIYGLRYEYEYGKAKDLKNLMVISIFVPPDIAKQQREWALQQKKIKPRGDKWLDSYDYLKFTIKDLDPAKKEKCEALLYDILKSIDDNRSCITDSDCMLLKQDPFGPDIPIRKDKGPMALEKMTAYKESCDNGLIQIVGGMYSLPVCWQNKCMIKTDLKKTP